MPLELRGVAEHVPDAVVAMIERQRVGVGGEPRLGREVLIVAGGLGVESAYLPSIARRGVSEELSTSVATASKTVPFVITTLPNPP